LLSASRAAVSSFPYLSDPGSGQMTRFSIPLGDRLCFCDSCRKEYATLKPGVDPCWRCGTVPDEE
jgi:hypothetical protein